MTVQKICLLSRLFLFLLHPFKHTSIHNSISKLLSFLDFSCSLHLLRLFLSFKSNSSTKGCAILTCILLKGLCDYYKSNLRTHPQPLLLKIEGAKTNNSLNLLKVPLLVREGFRVSLLCPTRTKLIG